MGFKKFISTVLLLVGPGVFTLGAQESLDPALQTGQNMQKKQNKPVESTAWTVLQPLGLRIEADVDTVEDNYYRRSIPSLVSDAWACTGNLGCEGENMLYMQRPLPSAFFLQEALSHWLPEISRQMFFNTALPMTQLAYNTGGGRDNSQDRLTAVFSGNLSKIAQIGANMDYLYSKGSYENQAAKHLNWGFSGSYLGDRYEFQGSWNHYNSLNKENGGITDDLYITDPAKLQGGIATINPKSIPTNLSHAHTRVVGGELFLNNRYKVGYYDEELEGDSVVSRTFIPVTSFIWTLRYRQARHRFLDGNTTETDRFFENRYLTARNGTDDVTSYNSVSNTFGISLLEGFNKYAKFGLAAYITYEIRHFRQTPDTLDRSNPAQQGLTPFPEGIESIAPKATQNLGWIGAQLTKTHGDILRYEATAELGLIGDAAGEVKASGNLSTNIPLLGDTVTLTGYGSFYNTAAPYLLCNYVSNHFVWNNDFGKERRLRFGGSLLVPHTGTLLDIGVENAQNLIYFNEQALPTQHGGSIQVLSASLTQNFRLGILHWDNRLTYQTTSDDHVLPLPSLAVYSNLYIKCRIATLSLQLGIDCDYYTSYYAPAYQPATASFHNQREIKLGNYPFMNAYANMKLGRCRFYVMMTHVNQGIVGGNNYFSLPHYPLNPRRFQMGLSVDFIN